jgi:hypothetical protein
VILKAQSTSLDSAHLEVLLSNDRIRIWSYSPAAGLVQHGPSVPATLADGARFGARAYPNGVVEVFIEDTLAASTAVTDWPWIGSGGRIGFRMTAAYVSRLDDFGGGDGDPSGNRPPVALVTSPAAETTFYAPGDTIRLAATGLDPDDAPESLDYHWSVLNRHIGHAHPTLQADAAETSFVATNHGEGASVSYEMRIFVFDPAELSATALVRAFPDVDLSPGPVSVLPATPVSGESAQWSFRLRNTGRMKTLPTRWQLVLGADVIAEGDTTIAAHDSVLVTRFTTVSAPPGSYDLRIVADTLAAAVETDETNNALDASLEVVPPTAGVEARPSLELAVRSPVPNPTSGAVRFEIELLHAAELRLAVLDLQGREIWSGAPARRAAGVTSLAWNGRLAGGARAAPGVYHARVLIDGRAFARRFVVLR